MSSDWTATGSMVRTPPGMTDDLAPASATRMAKHSLVIAGHRTSISLEDAFWIGLKRIADGQNRAIASLVAEIDATRGEANLSSAIRVFVLERQGAGH